MPTLLVPRTAYAVLSQGLVSACNLLLCLALLYLSDAKDYVAFILFLNIVQLLTGLQNALYMSPVSVMVPYMPAAKVRRTERTAYRMAALVALPGLPFIAYFFTQPPRLAASALSVVVITFIATTFLLQREIARHACLIRSDLHVLVKYDFLYFTMAMALAGGALALGELSFIVAVLAMSLPALVTGLSRPQWPAARDIRQDSGQAATGTRFWDDAKQVVRWSVPGVVVTWLISNGYWFVLEHTQDAQLVATIGAARLLFTPIGLLNQGWQMQLRPVAVAMAHAGQFTELRRKVFRQSLAGAGCVMGITTLGFGLAMYFPAVLPEAMQVPGATDHVIVWGLYFTVFWFRSGISIMLLTRVSGFKTVFYANVLVCATFYLSFFASLDRAPVVFTIATLIGAELIMLYLLNRHLDD